jgi:hypothetical protein
VPLTPLDLLGSIITFDPTFFGGLHRLTVDDGRTGCGRPMCRRIWARN